MEQSETIRGMRKGAHANAPEMGSLWGAGKQHTPTGAQMCQGSLTGFDRFWILYDKSSGKPLRKKKKAFHQRRFYKSESNSYLSSPPSSSTVGNACHSSATICLDSAGFCSGRHFEKDRSS